MLLIAGALLLFVEPAPAPPTFVISPPAIVVDFDEREVHGTPIELAWSSDSDRWYLETLEGEGASAKRHHFTFAVGDKAFTPIDAAPPWAETYWTFKSDRRVPAHPSVLIAVDESRRTGNLPTQSLREKARGATGGEHGGGDPATALRGAMEANNDYANAPRVLTLTVDGKMISQLVDEPLVPGMTFGWSPKEYDAIAFRNERHHGLSIWGIGGAAIDVDESRDVLLPAWSPDGQKIAFVEKTGKKKYELRQVKVSLP